MTPFEARHERMIQRLKATADRYRELVLSGNRAPAITIAAEQSVRESTARSWVYRARQHGLLPPTPGRRVFADHHQPRQVDWGRDSWTACEHCKEQWPCAEVDQASWDEYQAVS